MSASRLAVVGLVSVLEFLESITDETARGPLSRSIILGVIMAISQGVLAVGHDQLRNERERLGYGEMERRKRKKKKRGMASIIKVSSAARNQSQELPGHLLTEFFTVFTLRPVGFPIYR